MISIFIGAIRPLPPDNQPTGIFKQEIVAPVWVGKEGLAGDAQADRRVHGGAEKALHQYPAAHYTTLAAAFPEARESLVPGAMGENISTPGWDETTIAIGDVFQFGCARIQVSQPRSPCWKIEHRFRVEGMIQWIAGQRITGWYFRVLEEGVVEPGAVFERIERNPDPVFIAELLALWAGQCPDPQRLADVSRTPGLTASWVIKLNDRIERLRQLAAEGGAGSSGETPALFHPCPNKRSSQG